MEVVPLFVLVGPRGVIAWQLEIHGLSSTNTGGLDRSCRLLTAKEFAEIFAARQVLRGERFALHYRPGEGQSSRLGLAIPKKQAKTAVLRNAIKRQARELFRRQRAGLPAMDLILRLAQPIAHGAVSRTDKAAWRTEINGLFARLCQKTPRLGS